MNLVNNQPPYQWITDDQALISLVSHCRQQTWVVIDTEFMRTNTYYPRVGLIQLAVDNCFYLIDPLALENVDALKELLADTRVVKVMHACSEDLEIFQSYLNQLPVPLFDTQIAAALLGHGISVGYKTLVEDMTGVILEKGEQRSNWLQRPLTQSQQDYAIMDVVILAEIYQQQLKDLSKQGRLAWVEEECQNLLQKQSRITPFDEMYKRVKGAGNLDAQQLVVLQALAAWREKEVQQRDIPRGFLIKDSLMVALAKHQPDSTTALSKFNDIHPRMVRRDGQTIIDIIAMTAGSGKELKLLDQKLPRSATARLKQMQVLIASKAEYLAVPPELIMNRKLLVESMVQWLQTGVAALPQQLSEWKREQIGDDLLALMESFTESPL